MTSDDTVIQGDALEEVHPIGPSIEPRRALPPEIAARIHAFELACYQHQATQTPESFRAAEDAQRALETAITALVRDGEATRELARAYRAAQRTYNDLPNGCDGALMQAAHDELSRTRIALDEALAANPQGVRR